MSFLCSGFMRLSQARTDYDNALYLPYVLAFKRARNGDEILVLLNIAPEPRKWRWQDHGRLLISTHLDRRPQPLSDASLLLRGNEGVIIAVERS
jgi:hypothetical protein